MTLKDVLAPQTADLRVPKKKTSPSIKYSLRLIRKRNGRLEWRD